MAISKLPMPRLNELVTHGRVIVDCGEEDDKDAPIGRGFGIHQLTPQLALRCVFYPTTLFIGTGVLRAEILRVSELSQPNSSKMNSRRTLTCTHSWHLARRSRRVDSQLRRTRSVDWIFESRLASVGIQIGALSALAPSRTRLIARIGQSAVICDFISTL
ncbi:putative transporter YutK [Lactarius tabidus]